LNINYLKIKRGEALASFGKKDDEDKDERSSIEK
jgi:hypothetical protein